MHVMHTMLHESPNTIPRRRPGISRNTVFPSRMLREFSTIRSPCTVPIRTHVPRNGLLLWAWEPWAMSWWSYTTFAARTSASFPRAVLHVRKSKHMKAEYDFSKAKRGAALPTKGKTRITIHIDNAVLDEFRARAEGAGTGYQTMMNEALKAYLSQADTPVTESVLRRVVREEVTDKGRLAAPSSGRATKRRAA